MTGFPPGMNIRPPTHKPLDMMVLFQLIQKIRTAAQGQPLSHDQVEALATEQGLPVSNVMAAMMFDPNLSITPETKAQITVCVGRCQSYGAIENLEKLLELRAARKAAGEPYFDLKTKNCMDRCDQGPVMESKCEAGLAIQEFAKLEDLEELTQMLCAAS